jgi:hypothetical protein
LFLFQINRKTKDGRYSSGFENCHLIQTGFLFKFMKYPLFRFKCNYDIFYSKWFHWTQTINITFEANDNLTQISAELWQIRLYSIYPDCGEPEKILNSIENITPPNIAANEPYLVKCKPGFKLVGNELLKCLGCIEVKPCNIPETNNSLKVVISKLLTFNNNNITNIMADDQSYATYYCDNEEQSLKGTPVRQCINGLWVPDSDIFCENTITSVYSYDCGLPALPPQVFIEGYRVLTPPKIYKNGSIVNFDCFQTYTDILIGSKTSVCTDGKWNKKSGVCGN